MSSDSSNVYSPYKAAYHLDSIQDLRDGKFPSPKHVQLIISDYCQHSCEFCSYRKEEGMSSELFVEKDINGVTTNINPNRFLPQEKIIEILDDCKEMGVKAIQLSVEGSERIPIIVNYQTKTIEIGSFVDSFFDHEYKSGYECLDISDKNIGSFSIDNDGNSVCDTITHVYRHKSHEDLAKVTLIDGRSVTVTKSHSIVVYKNGIKKIPVSQLVPGDLVVCNNWKSNTIKNNILTEEFNKRKEKGRSKKQIPSKVNYTAEFARFLGYYTAEGSSGNKNHLVFTFGNGIREEIYINDLNKCIQDVFNLGTTRRDRIRNTSNGGAYLQSVQIDLASKTVSDLMSSIGALGLCQVKTIPDIVWDFSDDLKIEYLSALFSGDGNFRSTKYKSGKFNRNVLNLKTSSKSLADGVFALLLQLGCSPSITSGTNKTRTIEGRILNPSVYYSVSVSNREDLLRLNVIVSAIGGKLKYKDSIYSITKKRTFRKFGDSYLVPIKKIENIEERPVVYDITVGYTHRFTMLNCIENHNTGGGDPSASPHFKQTLEAVLDRELDLAVVTHGAHIKEGVPELLSRGQWVRFSIDAGTAKSYERIRKVKPGTMEKTLSNIKKVVAARNTNPNSELVIGCGFVVTKDNYKEVVEAAKIISDLGVDNMRISAMFQKGNFDYFKNFYDEAKDLAAKAEEYTTNKFKVINLFGNRIQDLIDESPDFKECYYASMTTYIGADSNVYMCCTTSYTKHGMQGSLKFQSFKDFWESEARKNFQEMFDSKS